MLKRLILTTKLKALAGGNGTVLSSNDRAYPELGRALKKILYTNGLMT